MKKKLLFALVLLLSVVMLCTLTSCDALDSFMEAAFGTPATTPPATQPGGTTEGDANPDTSPTHTHDFSIWRSGASKHWLECACGEKGEESPHVVVVDQAIEPTCKNDGKTLGEHCEVCDKVIYAQETIPATGNHITEPCGMELPSFTEAGCLSGEKCTVCGTVTDGEQILPAFEKTCGNYAYTALASRTNGNAMQQFYKDLYAACVNFHTDTTRDAYLKSDAWVALTVAYKPHGISSDDAFTVLYALQADCPLFYWIDNLAATDGTNLSVYTTADYRDGDTRASYNAAIYQGILNFNLYNGSAYDYSLYLHDELVNTMTYAYKADGITPEDALWAHSILGYFTENRGVCETYAETFSMMLNYWGVENIVISGVADGVNHEWNMAKMDDGRWYWFDLTWDDQPALTFGRIYDYFCQTDVAFANRTVKVDLYPIPSRSTTDYTATTPTIGNTLTTGSMDFTIVGYDEVELTSVSKFGSVSVPAQITYQNRTYSVVSIGNLENNTLMAVFSRGVTSVTIPATVSHIRGNALSCTTLSTVTVAEDNPYFFVEGGIAIYTKEPCVLVCLLSFTGTQTFTLREDTVGIASWAILNCDVKTIVIPASVTFIESRAVYSCDDLTTIRFTGNEAAWALVETETDSLPLPVICTGEN